MRSGPGLFDLLSPAIAIGAVEEAFGIALDSSLQVLPSYVNRVYAMGGEDGRRWVAKFHRPGRWTAAAIEEEHRLVLACAAEELPVVAPVATRDGGTLATVEIERDDGGSSEIHFSLYPLRGGRNFDAEAEGDWRRIGALASRLQLVAGRLRFKERQTLDASLARGWLTELLPLIDDEIRDAFQSLALAAIGDMEPSLSRLTARPVHGDLHRGNILERPGEGLLVFDFDDCMTAPPVQDLWLLLPGRVGDCRRELDSLVEGYRDFGELEAGSIEAIESLRFLRMLHFLAWRARQRHDGWFIRDFPDWGTRAYWKGELDALREQCDYLN